MSNQVNTAHSLNLFGETVSPVRGKMEVHFSSKTVEWSTPDDVYRKLDSEFHFDLDVCSTHENAKCERHFTVEDDGLSQPWEGTCWVNPPYAKNVMSKWVKKAYESSLQGATVVCLIPSRTDTAMWHDYCMKGEIRFIRGRLKFGGSKDSAPFPSAIVIFRPKVF